MQNCTQYRILSDSNKLETRIVTTCKTKLSKTVFNSDFGLKRKISGHSYQMPNISGQSVISGQFQDSFEISEISGRLWPLLIASYCRIEPGWCPIMLIAVSLAQILKNCVKCARTLVEHQSTMQFQQNRWPHGVTVVCLLVSRHSEHLRLTSSATSPRSVPTSLHHLSQANKTRCRLILNDF